MPVVASVRLRYVPKDYWFDPAGVEVEVGDHVIVETERGREIGLCVATGLEVEEGDLKAPLKPILRVASEEDLAQVDGLNEKTAQAMRRFRELVEEHELDMKPVEVEFMYDGSHATFYFTADERIDFRGLVRELASEFHIRVDMRQIGVRDEARSLGGLGHCGQELCCARMGGEFMPVSIRMAKEQDLPLNPSKISGLCGRLMCCLRYEFEAYKDFKSRAPKKNAFIDTPLGMAKVVEFDTPREKVRVRFEDGKSMDIPVGAMDTGDKVAREGENIRPCHISQEKFDELIEELNNDKNLAMMGDKLFSDDPNLADREAQAGSVEHTGRRRRRGSQSSGSQGQPRQRRRGGSGSGQAAGAGKSRSAEEPTHRTERRRRRSVAVGGDANTARGEQRRSSSENASASEPRPRRRRRDSVAAASTQETPARQGGQEASKRRSKPRPGQHSSTVSGTPAATVSQEGADATSAAPRKRRRRGKRGGRGRGGSKGAGTSTTSTPSE